MQSIREKQAIPSAQEGYRHFAFISYSRKDEVWAKWLQKKLETYRLPAVLRKGKGTLPAKLCPVFLDQTDLCGTVLEDRLQQALEGSRYLIVICSPHSAASPWVAQEVEYFLSLGRAERIIPFIVDGKPFSAAPGEEAFPLPLRKLDKTPMGVEVEQYGRHKSFLWVVSTMLGLQFDELLQRERKRTLRRGIAAGIAGAALLTAAGAGLWYNLPHAKYYENYVSVNQVPVGITELDARERTGKYFTYKITTRRNQVVKLESVNAEGYPIDRLVALQAVEYPISEYTYDEQGQLLSITEKDENGSPVTKKLLTWDAAANRAAIDYRTPENAILSTGLQSDTTELNNDDLQTMSHAEITRELCTYDDAGRLIQVLFRRDSLDTPACDGNGVYGKQYRYNDRGQILQEVNLDAEGKPHNCRYGWAEQRYVYDQQGRCTEYRVYDHNGQPARRRDGAHGTRMEYDDRGNVTSMAFFSADGTLYNANDGHAQVRLLYNQAGQLCTVSVYDADGAPCVNKENGVHQIRREHGQQGLVTTFRYFDAEGNPTLNKENGIFMLTGTYDKQGRLITTEYFDTAEQPTMGLEGFHSLKLHYDEQGRSTETYYYNTEGALTQTKYGFAFVRTIYDENGNPVRTEYGGTDGALCLTDDNYAAVEKTYDAFGNVISIRFLDEHNQLCYIKNGYAEVRYTYENGRKTAIKYYDTQGNPTLCAEYWHERRHTYDDRGNQTSFAYYDTAGELVLRKEYFAVGLREFDRFGNVIGLQWLDTEMQPMDAPTACDARYTYDDRGNRTSISYRSIKPNARSWYTREMDYDSNDRIVEERYYRQNGELYSIIRYTYDARGNRISSAGFDGNGQPADIENPTAVNYKEMDYNMAGHGTSYREYHVDRAGEKHFLTCRTYAVDAYGNVLEQVNRNEQGEPVEDENGAAYIRMEYNAMGYQTLKTFWNTAGEPATSTDAIHRQEAEYDAMGHVTRYRWFGTDGKALTHRGVPMEARYVYDHLGNEISLTYYDEHGNLYSGSKGFAKRERQWDTFGYLTGTVYYDETGTVLKATEQSLVIKSVGEQGTASAAGMSEGSIVLRWCDWDYYAESPDLRMHRFYHAITLNRTKEKNIVVYDPNTREIRQFTFPEGLAGARVVGTSMKQGTMEALRPLYEAWLAGEK